MAVGMFVFPVNQAEATGRTYYVSVADGNDTYDGTEETHTTGNTGPWQTIAKVNGLACGSGAGQLYAGDTVKFKTGETWREQLTIPCSGIAGNSITFGAYGSGEKPIIDPSGDVPGWTTLGNWTGGSSGSVTLSNMKLSYVNGTAFVDFSTADALTPYIGQKITIFDHSGNSIYGYIKAAGTGETLATTGGPLNDGELFADPGFDDAGSWSIGGGWSVSGSKAVQSGGATGYLQQTLSHSVGILLKRVLTSDSYTSGNFSLYCDGVNYYPTMSSGTKTQYFTSANGGVPGDGIYGWNSLYATFTDTSLKQVLTPSTTGVTITTTSGGSTYNWTVGSTAHGPFQMNDWEGDYTYVIGAGTNSWQISIPSYPAANLVRVWLSGTEAASAANSVVTSNLPYYYDAAGNLYVYATSNPASYFSSMVMGATSDSTMYSIYINTKSYLTFDGLDIRGGTNGFFILWGNYVTIQNNNIGLGSGYGINANSSTYLTINNNVIESGYTNTNYDPSQWPLLNIDDGIRLCNGVTYTNIYQNTISNWQRSGVGIDARDAGSTWSVAYNNIYQNDISCPNGSGCSGINVLGKSTDPAQYNNFYQNYIHDTTFQSSLNGNNNAFYYNIISNVQNRGLYPGTSGGLILSGGAGGTDYSLAHDNSIFNNTFYNLDEPAIQLQSGSGAGSKYNNVFENNVILNAGVNSTLGLSGIGIYVQDGTTYGDIGANTYKNNLIYKSGITNIVSYWGTAMSVATFNAATGHSDTIGSNIQNDPLFTNATTNDFSLQSISPAIDAGADLGTDYQLGLDPTSSWPDGVLTLNQNSYGSGWDIGAYVYTQSTPPTVSISAPSAGTVSGSSVTVSASASATSPAAISSVQFYLDGSALNSAITSSPYSTTLNTTALTNGSHTLYALATDNYGNTGTSAVVTVTVSNGGGGMPVEWYSPPKSPTGGFGISINNGSQSTSIPTFTLALKGGSDTARMAISNFSDFRDTGQENYTSSKIWNLCWKNSFLQTPSTCPAGTYTVYAKYYTSWGTSSGVVSDTIIYKTGNVGIGKTTPITNQPTLPSAGVFTQTLKYGSNNKQVTLLQDTLKNLGFFSQSIKSNGNFGPTTKQSVQKFQCQYNLVCSGNERTTGYGQVGPKTRQMLNQLKGG